MSRGSDNDDGPAHERRDPEAGFAEVLNGFSLDSGKRRRRHRSRERDDAEQVEEGSGERADASAGERGPRATGRQPPGPEPPEPEPPPVRDRAVDAGHSGELPRHVDELSDAAAIVRPYAWTQGRTKANLNLRMETLVSTSDRAMRPGALAQLEHRMVAELCRHPHAVAEVAAKLSVPLGVARVLLSDMADQDLIVVHQAAAEDDDAAAQLMLMERVLSGLRRL